MHMTHCGNPQLHVSAINHPSFPQIALRRSQLARYSVQCCQQGEHQGPAVQLKSTAPFLMYTASACPLPSSPGIAVVSRRSTLLLAGVLTMAGLPNGSSRAADSSLSPASIQQASYAYVSASGTCGESSSPCYPTISQALTSNGSGAPVTIRVGPGLYQERLVISGPVIIEAYPQGSAVKVQWITTSPYESVVECTSPGVVLRGLTLRHSSKSVANNYAVYLHAGGNARLEGLDIMSSTGSGVGIEDASPVLLDCTVHDCASHGVAIFGPLEAMVEPAGGGTLQGCDIHGNKGSGVLVRSGAAPDVRGCNIHDNREWGLNLQDCAGVFTDNSVTSNNRGAVQVVRGDRVDPEALRAANKLTGALVVKA